MIVALIAILLICIANLVFNAVLLFHLGRLVTVATQEDPKPTQLIQVTRPKMSAKVTEDGSKNALKERQNLVSLDEIGVDKAISAIEDWAK